MRTQGRPQDGTGGHGGIAPARRGPGSGTPTVSRRISASSSRPAPIWATPSSTMRAAPADQLAEHAAGRLAEHDAQDLARREARQHRLAALVGDDVAEPGDGQRNDRGARRCRPGSATATSGPSAAWRRTAAWRRRPRGSPARPCGACRAHRPAADHDLEQAVGEREGGDDDARAADRDAELARDLRQQRVADAQVGRAGEAGERQQDDGARRGGGGSSGRRAGSRMRQLAQR